MKWTKTDEYLSKMEKCAPLLPPPGDHVVENLIKELRVARALVERAGRFEIYPWVLELRSEARDDAWVIMGPDAGSSLVMNHDWESEYEPMPSSRTVEFIRRTRWTLDEALAKILSRISEESTLRQALEANGGRL